MKGRPRLTEAVMDGLEVLAAIGFEAPREEADGWWTEKEQQQVFRALQWIRATGRWRAGRRKPGA